MKTVAKRLVLLLSIVLLLWYLARLDSTGALEALKQLGWLAPLILVPYSVVYLVDCFGWRIAFPETPAVPFSKLFRIRWIGESLNNVVPSAYIGGEALKVYLLGQYGVTPQVAASGAVISKMAQTVAQVFFISLASLAFLYIGSPHPGVRAGMALLLMCGVLVVLALFWVQRRGLLGALFGITGALGLRLRALDVMQPKIEQIDRAIANFYHARPRRFLASTGVYFCGWLLDTTEIYIASRLLGMPVSWWQALCVEAFTGVAKVLGMWVPGSIGVQESGIVLIGRLTGLPDTLSFTYALIRRIREAIFVLGGWILLYLVEAKAWRRIVHPSQKDGHLVDVE